MKLIEHLLNSLVIFLGGLIAKLGSVITPAPIKALLSSIMNSIESKQQKMAKSYQQKKLKVKDFSKAKTQNLKAGIAQKKKVLNTGIHKVQTYDYKSVTGKKIYLVAAAFILPFFGKIQKWLLALKPTTVAGIIITSTITTISGINIYSQSKKIADEQAKKNKEVTRKIASISHKRPTYFKLKEKQLRIRNVAMPIYIEKQKSHRPVKMDITIETSNKYTRNYLNDNFALIHDYLNTKLLPIIPEFTMLDEGKNILKSKITKEINKLIKEKGIKGEVKHIYIHSLLSS